MSSAEEDPSDPNEIIVQKPLQIRKASEQSIQHDGSLPSPATLVQAAKLAIAQDKPILLDYYTDSYNGKAFMGEDVETKEKMLVKSSEEFTSMIQKTYKVADDYIVLTENSIYIVNGKLQKRRIQANTSRND